MTTASARSVSNNVMERTTANSACNKRGKKVRRGGRNTRHVEDKHASHLKIFSTNAASIINGKLESLKSEIICTKSNVVTIQETHSSKKGKIHIPNFLVFEAIRPKKGGGTLIAVHKDLEPKLIEEYNSEFELLVVEVELKDRSIRIISGYGPQENWEEEKRIPFFLALETEIEKAELAGKSVIIEMDANSKLGAKYIPKDPHPISPNGLILECIIKRHALSVANGSVKSKGTITRRRVTKYRKEESVIDIVLYSNDMENLFMSLNVDEEKKHVLKSIRKTKKGIKIKESDHNVLVTEFKCEVKEEKVKEKEEIYNLKNKECQKQFKQYTSNTNFLSKIFEDEDDDLDKMTERFLSRLKGCIARNFRKIRINGQKKTKSDILHKKLREIKENDDDLKPKKDIEEEIAAIAEENYKKLVSELDKMDSDKGGLKPNQVWRLKRRLCPNARDPPSAMTDRKGNILTSSKAIEERALEVLSDRLKPNEMKEDLKDLEDETNKLCEIRMKMCKMNKTEPWDREDLNEVLKQLQNEKSRDAEGLANEIFKKNAAGDDLFEAVLRLMNLIKKKQVFPKALEKCNITFIHKKKSKQDFSNYRGVFRVTILRSILDRLIYNSSYETVDSNLTDGNVGARKRRGCRDNIFVLSAISNSVINCESSPVQVQVSDVQTCFDKMWLQSCTNALYDSGLKNDMLSLLYSENRNIQFAAKVNNKLTSRRNAQDLEMQGSVWSSLKCTTMMDKLNQIVMSNEHLQYYYKEDKSIPIGIRGMVDDTIGVSKCGNTAVQLNSVINSFIETQRLTLSKEKSAVIHIGSKLKCNTQCPKLKVHDSEMSQSDSVKHLGNIVT